MEETKGYIDSHQHFWEYHPQKQAWITDDMEVICKDFLPIQLEPVLKANGIAGCVAVQADQTEKETMFLLHLAEQNPMIKAVVGWVDLRAQNIEDRLRYFKQFLRLKGFRHVLQSEEPSFMLQKDFLHGIGLLNKFHFTYDILIFPQHLEAATELVALFPEQPFVIDHIAKPYIRQGIVDEWEMQIGRIARYPNVYCKISGMVTEADAINWKPDDFKVYLDTVVEAFGINRIMYGSDWPVCLVAASYARVKQIVTDYFSSFSDADKDKIFRDNASKFYRI